MGTAIIADELPEEDDTFMYEGSLITLLDNNKTTVLTDDEANVRGQGEEIILDPYNDRHKHILTNH